MHERVSVITVYDHLKGTTLPWRVKWKGRVYQVSQLGLHHTRQDGNTLHHIFSVVASGLLLRLDLNSLTLVWHLTDTQDIDKAL